MFPSPRFPSSFVAGVALLVCAPAFAHDTWLLPDPRAAQGEMAVLLRTGPHYPGGTSSSAPQDVAGAGALIDGRKAASRQMAEAGGLLLVSFTAPKGGVATAWVSLAPALVELDEKQVGEYLDEASAPDYVRRAWAEAGAGRRWREAFTKLAKTAVAVGRGADESWRKPVGQRLEIVPESDPRALRVGKRLRVRVLLEGKPLPGLIVSCVNPEGRVGYRRPTDAAGRITCPLTAPGFWLVRGIELRRARSGGADWESLWASLTVDVRP